MARGINAARKLRTNRRIQRWSDYRYKKFASPETDKKSPFAGATMASGMVLRRDMCVGAKQPNSGLRKCVQVRLLKNGKKVLAYVPRDGCINFIDNSDTVLLSGFGRSGHAVGDIPGCRFKVVKVSKTSLHALFIGKAEKKSF